MIWIFLACGPRTTEPLSTNPITNVAPMDEPTPVSADELAPSTVRLDGVINTVVWDDGDTFHASPGERKFKARLKGFNTLESYGPIHRWGDWTHEELFALAKKAGEVAASRGWDCTDTGEGGGYSRALVDCPELRLRLLSEGLAHVFSLESQAPEPDLIAMRDAMAFQRGMWAKGVSDYILTSLHSTDERPGESSYNRLCDLRTGQCGKRSHEQSYATCEEVCMEDSCMIYVPYNKRYPGDEQADCLKP